MKTLLNIVLVMLGLSCGAQTYKLIPDSCTFCYHQYSMGGATHYSSNYHIDPFSDTVIIGNTYKRMFYNGSSIYSLNQPIGVRQVGNKLYGVVPDSTQEYLIMDFDASVGDTIYNLYSDGYFYNAAVTIKDSTLISGTFYHHWMELVGDTVEHLLTDYQGWIFRWQERAICNTTFPTGGIDIYPYGGVNFNLPLNYQLLGSAYVNVNYCTGDALFTNSFGFYCNQCGLSTNSLEELSSGKSQLLKILDIMGRETEDKPNTLLIYIYTDGTTEKVFRAE